MQPFGISVDSIHCHANWAHSLGGVSLPLLADFHPKGAIASAYGLYLDKAGITDRATVFIDAGGIIRHVSSVTPAGQRDMPALVAEVEALAAAHATDLGPAEAAPTLPGDARLFIKSRCGFSSAVLLARDNLRLGERLPVVNVTDSAEAMDELRRLTGKEQAPCLVADGQARLESKEIIRYLADRASPC